MSSSIASGKPRVFVSSTVHDFRDLRSALKFWLEEMGCDVDLSEHADFSKPLQPNSYDACLRTIEKADFFVLLIGSRVGGWFDEANHITITRKEYQHAYELFLQGKLTLVPFVRREIWDLRQDRKDLAQYLEEEESGDLKLTRSQTHRIAHHRGRYVTNAEAIFSFLDEVTRVKEMRSAVMPHKVRPPGNWIHPFANFDEIVAVLRQAIGLDRPLRRKALELNLLHEIVENAARFLERTDHQTTPQSVASRLRRLGEQLVGQISGGMGGTSKISVPLMNTFCIYSMAGTTDFLSTTFLEEAINSGEFLELDENDRRIVAGPTQQLLLHLLRSLRWYQRGTSRSTNLTNYARDGSVNQVDVENNDLFGPLARVDSMLDVVHYLKATYRHIQRGGAIPSYRRLNPLLPQAFDLLKESILDSKDVVAWLERDESSGRSQTT